MNTTKSRLLLMAIAFLLLPAASADELVQKELAKPEYQGYRIEPAEGFKAPGDAFDPDSATDLGSDSQERARRTPRREARPRIDPIQQRDNSSCSASEGSGCSQTISGVFNVMGYIVLGVVIAAIIVLIVRALMTWQRKPTISAVASGVEDVVSLSAVERLTPQQRQEIHALDAQLAKALAEGQFGRAMLLRYRIFWLQCGQQALAEGNDDRTWREALLPLQLASAHDLYARLRALLRPVEQVRYGRAKVTRERYEQWERELTMVAPARVQEAFGGAIHAGAGGYIDLQRITGWRGAS